MRDFALKVSKTLRHYARQGQRSARAAWWNVARPRAERPIFVIGCSRAGTTLVYKTLSESGEIGTLQRETHDFWVDLHPLSDKHWNTHGLNAEDASAADRAYVTRYFYAQTGHARWVDKNNQNGLCVGYLDALFADAHFVFIKRSPGDNINSLIEGWGRPEEFATWSDALPEPVNIDGRYRKWCFFLADGWRDYLSRPIEEVCAFQYRALNAAVLADKARIPPARWTEIFYEDILRDPVGTFRGVFEHCGLIFDARLAHHCGHVLDIPYNAFSTIKADKWREGRHAAQVERALPHVRDIARALGYDGDP
ncbi:MAG: sulfotransferase [Gammaproteobacteria bacterium]